MSALLVNIDVPDVAHAERFCCTMFGLQRGLVELHAGYDGIAH